MRLNFLVLIVLAERELEKIGNKLNRHSHRKMIETALGLAVAIGVVDTSPGVNASITTLAPHVQGQNSLADVGTKQVGVFWPTRLLMEFFARAKKKPPINAITIFDGEEGCILPSSYGSKDGCSRITREIREQLTYTDHLFTQGEGTNTAEEVFAAFVKNAKLSVSVAKPRAGTEDAPKILKVKRALPEPTAEDSDTSVPRNPLAKFWGSSSLFIGKSAKAKSDDAKGFLAIELGAWPSPSKQSTGSEVDESSLSNTAKSSSSVGGSDTASVAASDDVGDPIPTKKRKLNPTMEITKTEKAILEARKKMSKLLTPSVVFIREIGPQIRPLKRSLQDRMTDELLAVYSPELIQKISRFDNDCDLCLQLGSICSQFSAGSECTSLVKQLYDLILEIRSLGCSEIPFEHVFESALSQVINHLFKEKNTVPFVRCYIGRHPQRTGHHHLKMP